MLFLFCVALWFILRGASCLVMPCSLSSCFFSPFSIVITSLGEEGAGLCVSSAMFFYFARVNFCPFSLRFVVRGWLRLLIVSLLGLFYLLFIKTSTSFFSLSTLVFGFQKNMIPNNVPCLTTKQYPKHVLVLVNVSGCFFSD